MFVCVTDKDCIGHLSTSQMWRVLRVLRRDLSDVARGRNTVEPSRHCDGSRGPDTSGTRDGSVGFGSSRVLGQCTALS